MRILTPNSKLRTLNCLNNGAGGGIRTRDPNLGKVVLYQLSYTRINLKCALSSLANISK
jgi:hypothetical protein